MTIFVPQLLSREEQIVRFQTQLHEYMEEASRRDEQLRRTEAELHSLDDEKKRLEDVVQT